MKNKNLILFLLFLFTLISCGEDRTYEYHELTKENQWIYNTMKEVYLWKDDIKTPERSHFFYKSSKFFTSLLNRNDKASFFTDTIVSHDYGMSVTLMRDPITKKTSQVYALVLFVEPDSPADIAGVERGTWISAVNDKKLTTSSTSILQQGEGIKLATEYIEYDNETSQYFWVPNDTIEVSASTSYTTSNICMDSIYIVRDKKIGYILCNNFNGDDFISKANSIAEKFIAQNVTEIIVDLRYNIGGNIDNAVSFASMLVPSEVIGTPFSILKDNNGEINTTYNYTEQLYSLGDKKVYFIIGEATKGVAEQVVNSVNVSRDMYEVFVIGKNSAGVNLMVEEKTSPYGFAINPTTAIVYFANEETLPADGIKPDYSLDELEHKNNIHSFGKEQEYLLYNTMYIITNGTLPVNNQ